MDLMTCQGNSLILFTLIHFSLGRSFSVLYAIVNQMPAGLYFPLALVYDYVQIPVYGIILEQSSKRFFPVRWIRKKADRMLTSMEEKPLLKRILAFGDVGLILLSALPIRGFGILSGSIAGFFMKKGKLRGTTLLMIGSFLGILIIMGIGHGIIRAIDLF
jgi:uncharacterized membrane protein